MGSRSTCGYFIKNQLMTAKIVNLQTNQTVIDMKTANYSGDGFPACYYDESGTALVVNEPHQPHEWHFEFKDGIIFDFFLLNVKIPELGFRSRPINEIDGIRVRNVTIINEEYRSCTLDFTTRVKWAKIFWFWCTPSHNNTVNRVLSVRFTTYANQPIKVIGLHQVYITKLQFCGHPVVPLLTKYLPQNEETQQIECDPDVAIDVRSLVNSSDFIIDDQSMIRDCVDNEYWAGSPQCIPNVFCKLNVYNESEEISSVKNAYIFNKNKWYAIEGTTVHYKCRNNYVFAVDSIRTCLPNGTWDQLGPVCRIDNLRELKHSILQSSGTSMPTIILIVIIVVLTIVAVLVLVIIRRKQSERKLKKQQQMEMMNEKEMNIYDDIHNDNNNMYEDYAEPQYYENPDEKRYETAFPSQPVTVGMDAIHPVPYYLTLNSKNYDEEYVNMSAKM
ncbi:uncharacterized protein LOC128955979 [Oppia nitens]|uniref:uncharacterized protein LOC128955979 n=1 Tax=Oppia nitens TaxID=1686743 RepID=UPI0023DCCA12|nr:uncharacterized protein LOC128955979 [Oppia nitens]